MSKQEDLQGEISELKEKIRILTLENDHLSERAEDTLLLGLIGEKIHALEEPEKVLEAVLEQISVLKDIPFCACCYVENNTIHVIKAHLSFSPEDLKNCRLPAPAELRHSAFLLMDSDEIRRSGITIKVTNVDFIPTSALFVPFEALSIPSGVLLFVDTAPDNRFARHQVMLRRVAEMLVVRLDNLFLLQAVQSLNEDLDRKVEEKTGDLREANWALEMEVADRARAEDALTASESKFRQLFQSAKDAIFVIDGDGKFIDVNTQACQSLGYGREELLALSVPDIDAQFNRDTIRALIRTAFEGQIQTIEGIHQRKDRSLFPVEVNINSFVSGGERLVLALARDVSDRKRLEAQLLQSQKMESVGLLAGGIAHDFNNILSAIIGYASLLLMHADMTDSLRPYVETLLASAEKAAGLTQSLLAFSRKQIINPKPVDVRDIIARVNKLLIRLIGEDVEFRTSLSDSRLVIAADMGQIEQALMNLATNARDAMPQGGVLAISTGRAHIDADFIHRHGFGTEGDYALIIVADTGAGMDEKTLEKIFDPFFTTKEVGKGTGLGLAIVYGIVRQNNGFITCRSSPGKGTTFKIYFPLVPSEEKKDQEAPVEVRKGSETILIAEDDEIIRNLTQSYFREFGYTVLVAADGTEAVRVFRENADAIELLILDVVMPRKNGKEAYEEIKQIKPEIKVLFTSGYTADIMQRQGILDNGLHFIEKPASPMKMLQTARMILDG